MKTRQTASAASHMAVLAKKMADALDMEMSQEKFQDILRTLARLFTPTSLVIANRSIREHFNRLSILADDLAYDNRAAFNTLMMLGIDGVTTGVVMELAANVRNISNVGPVIASKATASLKEVKWFQEWFTINFGKFTAALNCTEAAKVAKALKEGRSITVDDAISVSTVTFEPWEDGTMDVAVRGAFNRKYSLSKEEADKIKKICMKE